MDILFAAELRGRGLSFGEVAAELSKVRRVSRQAVQHALSRWGVTCGERKCDCGKPAKEWGTGRADKCQECIDASRWKSCECGAKITSKSKRCFGCANIARREFDHDGAVRIYNAGFSAQLIADYYSVDVMSVYQVLWRHCEMRKPGSRGRRDMTVAEWLEANP